MNFKIWYSICLLFLIYCFINLVQESFLKDYLYVEKSDDLNRNDATTYFLCFHLNQIKQEPKFNNGSKYLSTTDLLNYSIQSVERSLNTTNLFQLNDSYVYGDFICFDIKLERLNNDPFIRKFMNNYFFRLYSFSDTLIPYFFNYIYYAKDEKQEIFLFIFKQKVYFDLTRRKCLLDHNYQLRSARFFCLNRCFKSDNSDYALYHSGEQSMFDLNRMFKKTENRSLVKFKSLVAENLLDKINAKAFDECSRRCKSKVNCFYETFSVHRVRDEYYRNVTPNDDKIKTFTAIYKAVYKVDDFWLQFFSLFTLLTGTSLVSTTNSLIRLAFKKLKINNRYFNFIFFRSLKYLLIIFGLVIVISNSILMIKAYYFYLYYPNSTYSMSYDNEAYVSTICVPIEIVMSNSTTLEDDRNEQILKSRTIGEIIEETRAENIKRLFKMLYFSYYVKFIDAVYADTIIFKNETFENRTVLTRCYQYYHPESLNKRYERILVSNYFCISTTNLDLKFIRHYLTDTDQKFTSGLQAIRGEYLTGKNIHKLSKYSRKSICFNYESYDNMKCNSSQSCMDLCISHKYREKNSNNLTIFATTDETALNLSLSKYFVSDKDNEIERQCLELHARQDCYRKYFYESLKTNYMYGKQYLIVNALYEKFNGIELEISLVNVILDIISLEIVFFGTNLKVLFHSLIIPVMKRFRMNCNFGLAIFTFSLVGFFIHNAFIFHSIITDQLVSSGFFEKRDLISLPNPIICFHRPQIYETKDNHTKFTGHYADQIYFRSLYQDILAEVWYFNRTHKIHMFKVNPDFYSKEIEIRHFYYYNSVCLEIELKIEFGESDLYLLDTRNVLGVYFSKEHMKIAFNTYPYFMYRQQGQEFSESFSLIVNATINQITFERVEIRVEDKFEYLKNPSSLFKTETDLNSPMKYLEKVKKKFIDMTNKTSRFLFIEDKNGEFDLEIDEDDLIEQFYYQVQDHLDTSGFTSKNTLKIFYNAYNDYKRTMDLKSGFLFSISRSTRLTVVTNADNYTKLIINILNMISFWASLSILDLIDYIIKLLIYIQNLFDFLVRLKMQLRREITTTLVL